MKVIFDHNLSPRLAACLQGLLGRESYQIISLREKFSPDTKDVEIISTLNKEGGWVFISGDMRITKNKTEKNAFRSANIIGIFLSPGLNKASNMKKAERLIAAWGTIEKICSAVAPGAMFELKMRAAKLEQIR